MTTMIGRLKRHHWHLGCDCISSRTIKNAERRGWGKEWEAELSQYDRDDEVPFTRSQGRRLSPGVPLSED